VFRLSEHGRVVAELAQGLADEATGIVCSPSVRFQLASVSKQFAAAVVLTLAEDGRLSIDDAVSQWFDCPASWEAMRIRHLLSHKRAASSPLLSFPPSPVRSGRVCSDSAVRLAHDNGAVGREKPV